ncbi:MAG: N-acetylmuramoyl-L-alanine amidase [Streptomycetaceae bacterium]|nr:N-acetylmuramoyl-L-alanine amidase [Streptomycetaceae bacterium]
MKKYLRFKRSIAAATALVAGTALTVPTAAYGLVQSASGTSAGLQSKFSQAAQEFHVPLPVLLGLSYEESRWDGHHGQYNTEGGYGVMGLTDVTPSMLSDGGAGAVGRHDLSALLSNPVLHTLTAAAKLTGASPAQLRGNDLQNIRGGAALLASYERKLTGGTPPDPAQWYGAVAEYSGILSQAGAKSFVDDVFRTIVQGVVQRLPDGGELHLQAQAVTPITVQLDNPLLGLKRDFGREVECPPGVACTFLPAGSGNYQEANRLADGLAIRYIVIHDTESSYQQAIRAFKNPANGAAANYVMQSSTGKVTQVVPDKDVAFHTGNYWFNMHSVGIEHEGFAASGATWYTTAQYRATAHLVRYLAARYGIPLDRRHIIGHDNVPGPASSKVSGMHWDPGPYWDWTYFMHLLGAGRDFGLLHGVGPVGTAITITPDFATNRQTVQVCGQPTGEGGTPASTRSTRCSTRTQPSNFLYVRTAPRPTAPLFADPGMHSAGTTGTQRIDNWGNTVVAGQQFVVADKRGDWTAIWYAGSKVWFYNPDGVNTTPAPGATIVSAKPGIASAAVYGQAYPQPSEYPWGFAPSTQQPLSMYSVRGGQAYVANAAPVPADDFFAKNPPDTVVTGTEKYYVIQYNHRLALLNDAEVAPHSQVKSQVKSQFQRP